MKLKDVITGKYLNGVVLEPIRKRLHSSPLQQQHDNYNLDKNIDLLQRIVNSKSGMFPKSQMREFEKELQTMKEKRKTLA